MKKLIALLLGILLLVNIVACTAPVENTDSTTATNTTTTNTTSTKNTSVTTSTTPTASTASTTKSDNTGAVGGDGLEYFSYAKDAKLGGIFNSLYRYVYKTYGDDEYSKISAELKTARNEEPYAYTGMSAYFWVHRLDIPREKLVECNEKDKRLYKDSPWSLENCVLTDEEINDIYTLTTAEFNQKYKASTAVVVGELIYNFNWLYKSDIDLWQKQSFTVAQLQEAVDNAKKMENFPQGIAEAVEKKLNDYIAAVETQAVE